VLQFSEFYASMPSDNGTSIAPGSMVEFPSNGPSSGEISSIGLGFFDLPNIGTYSVSFSASVTEAAQLVLVLNGAELPYTVYGRAAVDSEITGDALVVTTVPDSVLSVGNPSGDSTALTLTPTAGGDDTVVASLTIEQIG